MGAVEACLKAGNFGPKRAVSCLKSAESGFYRRIGETLKTFALQRF